MSFLTKVSDMVLDVFGKDSKDEKQKNEEVQIKKVETEKAEKLVKEVLTEEVQEVEKVQEVKLSEIDALKKELSVVFENLSSMEEYWEAIVAIEAVAVSSASSDKDFSDAERKEIKKFIQNINPNKEIPSTVQEKIDEIYANPLPLNKAFLLAKETKVEMSIFEEILDVVMHTDGVKFEEKVVLNAWHAFKEAR